MNQDFTDIPTRSYSDSEYYANRDVVDYNITEADVECFKHIDKIVDNSLADPTPLDITNEVYFFL